MSCTHFPLCQMTNQYKSTCTAVIQERLMRMNKDLVYMMVIESIKREAVQQYFDCCHYRCREGHIERSFFRLPWFLVCGFLSDENLSEQAGNLTV